MRVGEVQEIGIYIFLLCCTLPLLCRKELSPETNK